jgi:hypothetical protein
MALKVAFVEGLKHRIGMPSYTSKKANSQKTDREKNSQA